MPNDQSKKHTAHQQSESHFFPLLFPDVLTLAERQQLIELANEDTQEGQVAQENSHVSNRDVRRSRIRRLAPEQSQWLMEKIIAIFQSANKAYHYDLTNGIIEPVQLASYDEADSGEYGWHLDIGPHCLSRKLSLSIPLNSPEEYQGGQLEFNFGSPVVQEQQAGQAIVFPSYAMHRVKKVSRGRRYSLVTWLHGPNWR